MRIPKIEYQDEQKHYHKTGTDRLMHYELACGYVMQFERNGQKLELWREPGTSVYAVRWHDHRNGVRIFWETFGTYTAAAQLYYRTRRNLEKRATAA